MTEIKEISLDNFEEIKSLFRSVFSSPPWNEDWSDDGQLTDYLLDLMKVRTPVDLGLYEDGVLIGISLGNIRHWCGGTEYYIEELCIRTEHQGRGLGTRFMELIEDHLRGRDIKQIFLATEKTAPAYEFYKKRGFTELTGHVSFFRELS